MAKDPGSLLSGSLTVSQSVRLPSSSDVTSKKKRKSDKIPETQTSLLSSVAQKVKSESYAAEPLVNIGLIRTGHRVLSSCSVFVGLLPVPYSLSSTTKPSYLSQPWPTMYSALRGQSFTFLDP